MPPEDAERVPAWGRPRGRLGAAALESGDACCSQPALVPSSGRPAPLRGDGWSVPIAKAPADSAGVRQRIEPEQTPGWAEHFFPPPLRILSLILIRGLTFRRIIHRSPGANRAGRQQRGGRAELSSCASFSLHNLSIFLDWISFHANWCMINWLLEGISEGLSFSAV